MNYTDFKTSVLASLESGLNPLASLQVSDIIKNNDTHMDGLTMLHAGQNLSPTVYLNHYYRQYQKGRPIPDILADIRAVFKEHQDDGPIDVSFFTDYERVKSRVIFKLVSYARNRELLERIPHIRFLDLAIVFNCLLESGSSGTATILIHNQHLSYWHITKDDLYALALANTPALLTSELHSMTEIVNDLFREETPLFLKETAQISRNMYVLTNQHKLNGAVCVLYPGLMRGIAEKLGSDLFILPSSVHEVLLIPASERTSAAELTEMVQDVNATQLAREEILSDHVYYFSRKEGALTL